MHSHLLRCVPALCRTGVKGHPGGAAVYSHTDLICDMLREYLHARPALKVALVVAGDVFSQPTIIVLGAEAVYPSGPPRSTSHTLLPPPRSKPRPICTLVLCGIRSA